MGLLSWLLKGRGHDLPELARRLDLDLEDLVRCRVEYRRFSIPKRSGGQRTISAPDRGLKDLQRRILRRLLARLKVHPAATGFEPGKSIVTNALAHRSQAVVLRFDLEDFFPSTSAARLKAYFRRIGWNRPATKLLLKLCTYEDCLPQGAPTSPRLSNLVNYRLDARLAGMARALEAVYTRYADDITISFCDDDRDKIHYIQRFVQRVVHDAGYRVHRHKKMSIRRRHQRQVVTGLVVNETVNLPRTTRRWLRAVEHRTRQTTGERPTLTPAQLEGWRALQSMIDQQSWGR